MPSRSGADDGTRSELIAGVMLGQTHGLRVGLTGA